MNTKEFLDRIFDECQGQTYLSTLPDKHVFTFKNNETTQVMQWCIEAVKRNQNVYFVPVTLNRELREGERGTVADVGEVLAFGADCDVFNSTKPYENLPKSQEEAVGFLMELPDPPSVIINSGNGIQPLWLFDAPYTIASEADREHIKKLLRGFQQHIRRLAKAAHGWQWDSTADLVRIYRLPGTMNFKDPINPKPTGVLHISDARYPSNFFEKFMQDAPERPRIETDAGSAKLVINNCLFCQHCRDNPNTIGYSSWVAAGTNIVFCPDGRETFHEISKEYQKYSIAEVDAKIDEALNNMKPATCHYIQTELGFDKCPPGGCRDAKSPISWATARLPRARAMVADVNEISENVLTAEVLQALNILFDSDIRSYNAFEERCVRAGIGKRVLKRMIKEVSKIGLIKQDTHPDSFDCNLPFSPVVPEGYKVTPSGIFEMLKEVWRRVTGTLIFLSKRQLCKDSGLDKIEITWKTSNGWRLITVPRTTITDARSLISLSGLHQFPANSENAKSLVRWLAAFEEANELPEVESVSKLGWYGDQYVPVDDILVDADSGCADFIGAYQTKGEMSVWKEHAAKARINPYARFLIAAACVAPLMKFAEIRSFLVLLWESSRQGKSAAMNIAASIWGNPTECLMQLNSTPVFIERLAAFHNTATIYLDEKQSAQNPKNLEFFCYLIANGKGKGRGSKLGIQQTAKWRTVAILTGEEPLTNSSSLAGVKTRILEVRGKPFDNESDSRNVYTWATQNYGHAGKIFIEKVKETSKEELRSDLEEIRRQLIEEFPEIIGSHIDALAAIGLADLLLSKSVFATMAETENPEYQIFIEAETAKMLTIIADGLETASEVSDSNRAEDFIESFIAQNNSKLQKDANGQIGEERDGILFLLTDVLDKALKEAGFSPSKARSELRDAGYFKTFTQSKKPMATTKRRFNGGEPRMYGIRRGKVSQVSQGVP